MSLQPIFSDQDEAVSRYSQKQVLSLTQAAHQKAWMILEEIGSHLKPGVTEAEMHDVAQHIFAAHGVQSHWHPVFIYFGQHSVKTFRDAKPLESLTLQTNDIAYLDLGPVILIDGHAIEGDVGQTFVVGDNPLHHQLKQSAEAIFHKACDFWREEKPTGVALYQYIYQLTAEAGFDFHLEPAGHLIGSFPHSGWRKGLNQYPYPPEPGLWILEIQIKHPVEPVGAFYEAVLL